jgi:hypothetical protein
MIDDVSAGVRMARDGRANGSIIGRNTFQLLTRRAQGRDRLRANGVLPFSKTLAARRG